jgi:uncharacterized protein (DUF697 family)
MRIRSIALAIVAAAATFATTAIAQTRLATEEMIVKSPDPGDRDLRAQQAPGRYGRVPS